MSPRCKCVLIIYVLLFPSLLIAQPNTADEQAIMKVINDEISAYWTQDYEQWASYWAHKPYVNAFWAGPGSYAHAEGWQALDAWTKKHFNNFPPGSPPIAEDTNMHINGDMAVIRFNFEGTMGLRVLERENGIWKLIGAAGVHRAGYDLTNMMKSLEGSWTLDKESLNIEGISGTMVGIKMQIHKIGRKLELVSKISWKNAEGNISQATQTFNLRPILSEEKAQATYAWAWDNGWADLSSSVFEMKQRQFVGQLISLGKTTPWANVKMDFSESARVHFDFQMLNDQEEENWTMEYDLVKDDH